MEKNQMSLEFSALSQNESFARVAVGSFFVQLNPTLEELAALNAPWMGTPWRSGSLTMA